MKNTILLLCLLLTISACKEATKSSEEITTSELLSKEEVTKNRTTAENYENHKGLEIATLHKDETGAFKLYFSDILVK